MRTTGVTSSISPQVWLGLGNDRGNNLSWGQGITPAPPRVYTMLCLKYIAKQATCILTPHVNTVNGVTYAFRIVQAFHQCMRNVKNALSMHVLYFTQQHIFYIK